MSHILVVDDEASIRVTLGELLRREGYTVDAAQDASQALRVLQAGGVDVVLSDIVLPGMSGLELHQRLRELTLHAEVIVMTGEPTVETAAEAVRSGAVDYLLKPISKNALLRAVGHAARVKALDDERRRLEEQNRLYQQQLEQRVLDRTRALEDALASLRQAQEGIVQQERLNALGQMVSGIAHDFNNSLMPIVGLSEFLLESPGALENHDDLLRDLTIIRTAARAAAETVRRLREFYRPDETLETAPVDLAQLAAEVIQLTEPAWGSQAQAAGRAIQVLPRLAPLPPLDANPSRLREVLTNLLLNAMDAMPAGGTITVETGAEGPWAVLKVSDTGTGMTDEVRRRCFEPFYTTKGRRGSGLGLAMCHGIVSRHGGEISVESEVGRGTTFTIRLPQHTAAPGPAAPQAAPAGPAPSLRVLVADDDQWARALLTRFLTHAGHRTDSVNCGEDALERLRSQPCDLVVTDLAMPGISGDQVAKEARRLIPGVPVIILTGMGDMLDDRAAIHTVADEVLCKPVTAAALEAAIARVVQRRANASPAAPGVPA